MARAIEDLGFDSIWLGEHLLYRWPDRPPRGPWEAWTLLAGHRRGRRRGSSSGRSSPARTSTTRRCSPSRPRRSTRSAAGGFILGLGAGWNETEFRAFGFPFDHRIDRFEEAFTIIRTLLREGAIDFDGRYYQARDCELLPRGPRPGGPPLMIGSNGPRMLRITLPHADAWNVLVRRHRQPPGRRRRRCASSSTTACRDVGRDPADGRADRRRPGPAAGRHGPDPGRLRKARAHRRWRATRTTMAEELRAYARRGHRPRPARRSIRSTATRSRHSRRSSRDLDRAERAATPVPPRYFRRGRSLRSPVLASGRHATIRIRRGPGRRAGRRASRSRILLAAACGQRAAVGRPRRRPLRRRSSRPDPHLDGPGDGRRRLHGHRPRPACGSPPTTRRRRPDDAVVKRINATYLGWPLDRSAEYRTVGRPRQGRDLGRRRRARPGRAAGRLRGHEHPHRVGPDDRRRAAEARRPPGRRR